jgi:hypothetical protein
VRHAPALDSLVFGLSLTSPLSPTRTRTVLYSASFDSNTPQSQRTSVSQSTPQPPRHKGRHTCMCIPTERPRPYERTYLVPTKAMQRNPEKTPCAERTSPAPRLGPRGDRPGAERTSSPTPNTSNPHIPHTAHESQNGLRDINQAGTRLSASHAIQRLMHTIRLQHSYVSRVASHLAKPRFVETVSGELIVNGLLAMPSDTDCGAAAG